jgi:hypothetical protein
MDNAVMCIERPSSIGFLANCLGWFAVGLSLAIGGFLAGMGARQAFFYEWWSPSILENLRLTVGHLLPALICVLFALLAIGLPRIGGLLHVTFGTLLFVGPLLIASDAGFLPNPNHPKLSPLLLMHLAGLLLIVMGIAYVKGRPRPRWLAIGFIIGLPATVSLICAAEPAWRICHRYDDGIIAARRVQGNGVGLIWAPTGPGWSEKGNQTIEEAEKIITHLAEDGLSVMDAPQNIWRLPTVDEVVRSLTRDGQNAGGAWDPELEQATYKFVPDKESPLWRVHSPVVHWWTSSRPPEMTPEMHVNYILSYRGDVSRQRTFITSSHLGFRAVKGQ